MQYLLTCSDVLNVEVAKNLVCNLEGQASDNVHCGVYIVVVVAAVVWVLVAVVVAVVVVATAAEGGPLIRETEER